MEELGQGLLGWVKRQEEGKAPSLWHSGSRASSWGYLCDLAPSLSGPLPTWERQRPSGAPTGGCSVLDGARLGGV